MGLRLRLNLLLSLILFLAFAAGAAWSLANARRAVIEELRASTELASALVQGLRDGARHAGAVGLVIEQLETHAHTRHLRIEAGTRGVRGTSAPVEQLRTPAVPAWFAGLVRPGPDALNRVIAPGPDALVIAADPADEIEEAWRETRTTLIVLLCVFFGANLTAFVFLGRALRPLETLSRALTGVERGDFASRLPMVGLPDIDRISERFNEMAQVLEHSHADNAMLAQRSLAIQEEERRHLARELHDEMGQSITAIKALAVSIRERAAEVDAAAARSAATIVAVSGEIYARVRRMMMQLHPVILDELGLVAALELMVDDWNAHHEECFCSFVSARTLPALAAGARIAIYRIVQEALTNVARHAQASEARVRIGVETEPSGTVFLAGEVSDNGVGFDPGAEPRGLGLVGIAERVRTLGGELNLEAAPGRGVRIVFRAALERLLERDCHGESDQGTAGR